MVRAGVISDDLWALIDPVLPSGVRPGRPWNDHRQTLEGIAWRFRTGAPWRDLPRDFGAWQSVWERHRRWSVDGTYTKMFAAVRATGPADDRALVELISVDSTSIRATSTRLAPASLATRGAESNDKTLPGEPADHALGRSRGLEALERGAVGICSRTCPHPRFPEPYELS